MQVKYLSCVYFMLVSRLSSVSEVTVGIEQKKGKNADSWVCVAQKRRLRTATNN